MSDDVTLVAGTIVEHLASDGTWKRVPRVTSTGDTGSMAASKAKTTLEDRIARYGAGLADGGDKNFSGQLVPPNVLGDEFYMDYLLQDEWITRCKNREQMELRITWPSLDRAQVTWKSLGFQINDGTAEDWLMFSTNGKQNSFVEFSAATDITAIAVSGDAAMTVGDHSQLSIVNTPLDGYYQVNEGVFTTSDAAVATVTSWGYVTAIAAGTATITVKRLTSTGAEITDTFDITVS